MSRIFDALRRTEQGKAGDGASRQPEEVMPQELLTSLEKDQATFDHVERVICQLRPEDHIIGNGKEHHLVTEKFKLLRYRLDQLRQQQPLTSVLVASSVPEEGKTMVAVNLALTLAMTSPRVLLLDADLRRPRIPTILRLGPLPGLAEYLEGRLDLKAGYRRVEPAGFFYLPAGHFTSKPVELLESPKMRELMKEAACGFDWLVLDSPPLLPFADGHCLAALSDATLLVVRDGFTPRDGFRRALTYLKDAYVAGVILNRTEASFKHSYYYPYSENKTPSSQFKATKSAPSQATRRKVFGE